jgi:Protein of unknown function (DUF3501)
MLTTETIKRTDMAVITAESLMSLEQYAKSRKEFRAKVLAHKKNRTVMLGEHVTLVFEDEMTMRYQIQEMLRVERIFEEEGIRDELNAYNPLVPDGSNWKATMLIQYPDIEQRRTALAGLIGVEDRVWVQIGGHPRVHPIADEDLERETDEKTSSVHFLRFELTAPMKQALKQGAKLAIGVDHPNYTETIDPAPVQVRDALLKDLIF